MLDITKMDFKLKDTSDSAVGPLDFRIFNVLAKLFEGYLEGIINLIFSQGISIDWLLKYLGLTFVHLDQTLLLPFDGYFIFYTTPTFDIQNAVDGIHSHLVQSINSLFTSDDLTLTQQEISLLTSTLDQGMKGTLKDSFHKVLKDMNK